MYFIRRSAEFLVQRLSRAITTIAFTIRHAIEGDAPPRDRREYEIDCPVHGRTFLTRSRQTECCASMQWLPAGRVKSRKDHGRASIVVFR